MCCGDGAAESRYFPLPTTQPQPSAYAPACLSHPLTHKVTWLVPGSPGWPLGCGPEARDSQAQTAAHDNGQKTVNKARTASY